jgi:hypothetical protein
MSRAVGQSLSALLATETIKFAIFMMNRKYIELSSSSCFTFFYGGLKGGEQHPKINLLQYAINLKTLKPMNAKIIMILKEHRHGCKRMSCYFFCIETLFVNCFFLYHFSRR